MFLIEKFLFIFTLETGGRITSWYCAVLNFAYIIVLMQLLNSFDVLKDPMSGFEKFQILCVASCVNFFIYYVFGSMVLTCGIIERNHRILKCFLLYHTAMTVSILFGGIFFSLQYTSPAQEAKHQQNMKLEKHNHPVDTTEVTLTEEYTKEPNFELLIFTTFDFFARSYMTMCVYSLYVIYYGERVESDFMNGSDKRLSYGSGTGSDKMTDNCSIVNER